MIDGEPDAAWLGGVGDGDIDDPRHVLAYLIGTLVFRVLTEALWADPVPTAADLAFVTEFCLAAVRD